MGSGQRDILLQYVDSLFSAAQLLTGSAQEASELVEQVYGIAGLADEATWLGVEDHKLWLYRLLLQQYSDLQIERGASGYTDTNLTRALSKQVLASTFPIAFAALEADDQVVLLLREKEGADSSAIAAALGVSVAEAVETENRLDERILELLLGVATPPMRALLLDGLPDDWMRQAVLDLAASQLAATPNGLKDSVHMSLIAARSGSQSDGTDQLVSGERGTATSLSGRPTSRWPLSREAIAAIGIVAAIVTAIFGYKYATDIEAEPAKHADILALSVAAAQSDEISLHGDSREVASEYVFDQTGRSVAIPNIRGAELKGTSIAVVHHGIAVPALRYLDADGVSLTIFIYTYQIIESNSTRVQLASDILRSLEREFSLAEVSSSENKLQVWRNRADIYVVTGDSPLLSDLDERVDY